MAEDKTRQSLNLGAGLVKALANQSGPRITPGLYRWFKPLTSQPCHGGPDRISLPFDRSSRTLSAVLSSDRVALRHVLWSACRANSPLGLEGCGYCIYLVD